MANLQTLADDVATRLQLIADRTASIARGIGLMTTASVGLAYLVGILVFPSPWRWAWAVVGLALCAIPAIAIWTGYRRLRHVPRAFNDTVAEVRGLAGDVELRNALYELVERDAEVDLRASLLDQGRKLNTVRRLVAPQRQALSNLWDSVIAIAALPGLLAVAVLGSLAALVFSVIVVLAGLLL